jgi:hypothetical protein
LPYCRRRSAHPAGRRHARRHPSPATAGSPSLRHQRCGPRPRGAPVATALCRGSAEGRP